jgi:hypothetical protein
MPAPLPPTGNLVVSLIFGRFRAITGGRVRFVAPGAVVVGALAIWLVPAQLSEHTLPRPAPVPQVPLQASSVGAVPQVIASVMQGGLPPPGPNQKTAEDCNPDHFEVHNGGCWLATEKKPPCPRGQWEHEKRCWFPVAHAARTPTSGEPHRVPVAEP